MKKLKLSLSKLKDSEVLTREQLKHIVGGNGSGGGDSCSVECGSGYYACCTGKQIIVGPPYEVIDASCKCVPKEQQATCGSGVTGSTSCSVG